MHSRTTQERGPDVTLRHSVEDKNIETLESRDFGFEQFQKGQYSGKLIRDLEEMIKLPELVEENDWLALQYML